MVEVSILVACKNLTCCGAHLSRYEIILILFLCPSHCVRKFTILNLMRVREKMLILDYVGLSISIQWHVHVHYVCNEVDL